MWFDCRFLKFGRGTTIDWWIGIVARINFLMYIPYICIFLYSKSIQFVQPNQHCAEVFNTDTDTNTSSCIRSWCIWIEVCIHITYIGFFCWLSRTTFSPRSIENFELKKFQSLFRLFKMQAMVFLLCANGLIFTIHTWISYFSL